MIDVHPPHNAAHTWKDFFIHIATILLLIVLAMKPMLPVDHRSPAIQLRS
jgi:hypothetical protein